MGSSFVERFLWKGYLLGKAYKYPDSGNCTGIVGDWSSKSGQNPLIVLCMHVRMDACFELV